MSEELRVVRDGSIFKEMKTCSPSDWGKGNSSVVGVEIDTCKLEISVTHLLGTMPIIDTLFYALLADTDVRTLIRACQGRKTKKPFRIYVTKGVSGCRDVFVTEYETLGKFRVDRTKKALHISCFDRLNEGFGGDEESMSIVEFIEIAKYLGFTDDMSVDGLLAKAGNVEYLPPRLAEDIEVEDYSDLVSKILTVGTESSDNEETAEDDGTAPEVEVEALDSNAIE